MTDEIDIVKKLFSPFLVKIQDASDNIINLKSFTSAFIAYEEDPKLIYTEIYKLELPDAEELIIKLPELYEVFLEELAEIYILGIENSAIIYLLQNESSLFDEKVLYFKTLEQVIKKQERKRLLKNLPNLSNTVSFSISDDLITSTIKKKAREDLRNKFRKWDQDFIDKADKKKENHIFPKKEEYNVVIEPEVVYEKKTPRKKILKLSPIRYIAIAAILVLAFFIWQPTQSSDKELLAYYSDNLESLTNSNFNALNTKISNDSERGSDIILNNYSKIETEKALSGLSYFKDGNYDRAKKILTELNPIEHNSEILFFLALSQLNTNNINSSILNLEYLLIQPEFSFADDVKFHLAMAYLKKGLRNKSKILLKELVANDTKFKKEANKFLKEMRWF